MDVIEAIHHRRAVRAYQDLPVGEGALRELIDLATEAPSAMNHQPWSFVIVHDKALLAEISRRAKARILADGKDESTEFEAMLADPEFDIFYAAPSLIVICARTGDLQAARDCYLAGENLMLAATARGLATCPIGFAWEVLAEPDIRTRLNIGPEWEPVLPIVVGYGGESTSLRHERRAAKVLHWD